MSAIPAKLVKELRDRTNVGFSDCKKALVETDGDIEKAVEFLRKAGQAKADKKASRVAAEGVIVIRTSDDHKTVTMVEINCETDFTARDESFTQFVNLVGDVALESGSDSLEALLAAKMPSGSTVEEARTAIITSIGENINIRRVTRLHTDNNTLGVYVHGGRIGATVELEAGDDGLAKDLAMHVAASNPMVISPEDVAADVVAKEKEIFIAQAVESGKPQDIAEKMVTGKLRKFTEEVSLLGQPFVKDPSTRVQELLKQANAVVRAFHRFEVGEGIEKEEADFAKEVMEQVKGA